MKDNILIAEFMEIEQFVNQNKLEYHNSWDWLMPVVEKIERDDRYDVEILQYGTRILERTKNDIGLIEIVNNIANISFDNKIEHTYNAIVQFINQYNKTK